MLSRKKKRLNLEFGKSVDRPDDFTLLDAATPADSHAPNDLQVDLPEASTSAIHLDSIL